MDSFTQRMLERARARQEKIDQKYANSGQATPKRKPLSANVDIVRCNTSGKSPLNQSTTEIRQSPSKSLKTDSSSPSKRKIQKTDHKESITPQKTPSEIVVTTKEFNGQKEVGLNRRNSDVSVEINIMHRNDIQIEVQVEEREVPINVMYEVPSESRNSPNVKEIEESDSKSTERKAITMADDKSEKPVLRNDIKSRLDRLGNLYSDNPNLSSPIHRTENEFTAATPPPPEAKEKKQVQKDGKKKFGRLAALADQINNWEDDLTHHSYHTEPIRKPSRPDERSEKHESSTLDVSIHSIKDVNAVLQKTSASNTKCYQASKPGNSSVDLQSKSNLRLDSKIVAELEGEGYRRISAGQSRLVYDFAATTKTEVNRRRPIVTSTTPSATSTPDMSAAVYSAPSANPTLLTKKPSIKKYKAPSPPQRSEEDNVENDKENNIRHSEGVDTAANCVQTQKPASEQSKRGSPLAKRPVPKLNVNDRGSVLSKAAMFEAGSPKAKDPAEMTLRERKALFEKNKGVAIIPKAPFGLGPSVKTLHGDNKDNKPARPVVQPATNTSHKSNNTSTNNSRCNSKEDLPADSTSKNSFGNGIKGKLAALFNKEQTISETAIVNKFKQEREKDIEMLQNRFHHKAQQPTLHKPKTPVDSEDDHDDDQDLSENVPLMGSCTSLPQAVRKPEVVSNIPKLTADDKTRSETALNDKEAETCDNDKVIGTQPVKRRNSQDSPVVLSVLEDVKRIKVNNKMEPDSNRAIQQQTMNLYPHLSDIETDTSNNQETYEECGGSSSDNALDTVKNSKETLNKSDNWAETSFGREVMNVVKRNNKSYQKAVRESLSSDDESACDSELDDMLDEALNDEDEGPTPPKVKHGGSGTSTSFVYRDNIQFKSPKKLNDPSTPRRDTSNELVHSVSFYRRLQNQSSNPSTPLRVIRHASPERDVLATPDEPVANVTTVRQRIKELQNEISKQQTVISQASQALNLCASTVEFSGSTEQAEGERLLLLATHRRQACVHELQRLQVEGAGVAATEGMASLHLTSLSVPLRRDYMRQLNADGAVGHHMLLLIKCRDRVLASSMQLTQPTQSIISFPDEIRMDGLGSDFKITVEIYLLQASKEVLPHNVKYHISNKKANSKLLTPKSKVSELKTPRVQSPAGPMAVRTPQFTPHGYCIFALQQASRKCFTLNKVPAGSPLEGSLNVDIKARIRVSAPSPYSSFLTSFDDVSGLGAWHRRWFRLQPPRLTYWKYPDDVNKKMPIGDIDLTTVVSEKIVKAPRDLCARPNTLLLETSVPPGLVIPDNGSLVYFKKSDGTVVRRHLLAADTTKDRDKWLESLNQALEYVRCCSSDE